MEQKESCEEFSNHSDLHPKQSSNDETLIEYLIKHPLLWNKSHIEFRNRSLKEFKWKEIANKMNMGAHEAIRRYKTLCERYRREMIKQASIPNYNSNWILFNKFAVLKDVQNSEDRKFRIKTEDKFETSDMMNTITDFQEKDKSVCNRYHKRKLQKSGSVGYENIHDGIMHGLQNDLIIKQENDGRDSSEMYEDEIHVEPSFIGGSADLSTDTIAAFCQFLEASLKRMNTDQSDDLIENISLMLFRKKRENKLYQDGKTSEESTLS
ncbi:uncharacterized protein LOC116344704 [Contarinia nasturtii]|uniref:uncharacterized protein LOC116344704 n=1 Tax=Contarinia nasturtii TaxID=265458 RepID=UPI0012D3C330|nr:uncharacterized protein LOC116344704 [Contarinia nasturtii]